MKKRAFLRAITMILAVLTVGLIPTQALADDGASSNPTIILNSTATDIGAFYQNDVCYVEARPVFEYFGTVVFWNDATQTIALNSRDGDLGIQAIGSPDISVDGNVVHTSAPSVLVDGVTYMPLGMLSAFIVPDDVLQDMDNNVVQISKGFSNNEYNVQITKILSQISELENYNPLNFQDYLTYQAENPSLAEDNVVLYVNIGVQVPPYSDVQTIDNPDNVFVVVDKNHKLPSNYVPSLTKIDGFYWKPDAGEAWLQMKAAARADGVYLTLNNTYRSYATQVADYYGKIDSGRSVANVDSTVARPGFSEHQTGYAADVNPISGPSNSAAYQWIAANSYKYGFIVSFQADKEFINHYSPEPWHIRWFPQWAADIMYEQNLTIQEFSNLYINPNEDGFSTNLATAKEIAEREYVDISSDNNDSAESDTVASYTVTFDTNGGNAIASQNVIPGGTVVMPINPIRDGFVFEGWYSDLALTTLYDFSTVITGDIAIYAKWA